MQSRLLVRLLPALVVGLFASLGALAQQAPAVVAPPTPPVTTPPTGASPPPPGTAAAPPVAVPAAPQDPAPEPDGEPKPKPTSRRGVPVDDPFVVLHCARCHVPDDKKQMSRISYVRKSPEGWAETIKRMGRLHGLQLTPADARQLVRTLANSHGLTRDEAERGLYESERRVHWSEDHHEQDFKRACAPCHPLGRVLLQQRDDEEWQLLRATHVAMFPLARGQMGGGPPDDESRRFGGGGGSAGAAGAPASGGGGSGNRGRRGEGGPNESGGQGGGAPTQSVGDRVLQKLAKDQPLFTPSWERWTKNKRDVPLQGTWTVHGHETGRGDLIGTATLQRTAPDEYDISWQLRATDGSTIARTGKGLLYAGYSWRGRSQDAGENGASWREVLLLDDAWQVLRGRLFTGNHDEVGADVTLVRDQGRPRVLALGNRALEVPCTGHALVVHGESFPATVGAADFFVGDGLTITAVERASDREVTLRIDVAAGTELGPRAVAYGTEPGGSQVVLYDTVDYVRITPLQGLARVGGSKHPNQIERFEAFARHRGADGKPYTPDDVDLFQVRPQWGLAEFRVRENDDDLQYVGSIDATTGVFTPNVDGPNPARKWQANNIGDVFVTASVELDVPVRPAPPAVSPPARSGAGEAKPEPPAAPAANQPGDDVPPGSPAPLHPPMHPPEPAASTPATPPPSGDPVAPPTAPTAAPVAATPPTPTAPALPSVDAEAPPPREKKTFFARSHLLVTVPLYMRWAVLDWEDR